MSSNKYVPPSKRAQMNKFDILNEPEEEPEKKVEDEFPSLVSTTVKPKQWEGKRKFSELAIQAELRAKEEKYREEIQKSMQQHNFSNYLPKFDNVHRFVEPEDQQYEEVEEKNKIENEDEWVTVKHSKARKAKNIEEIANRPPTPEEKSDWNEDLPEDSDWN